MSAARSTLSIGEVLSLLKPDFPDVSVSKIRFLEGEGLIAPQRTASGYRKFSGEDIERLRFILTLQRDSFLPLKVIRERLAALDAGIAQPEQLTTPAPLVVAPPPVAAAPAPQPAQEQPMLAELPSMQLTEADLAAEAGLDVSQIRALREFGVLCEHADDGRTFYDAEDLEVGKLARSFMKLGVEPRHLKTLRRFAEQEADMFAQLAVPAMRNRRPEVREQAAETLAELAKLGRALRSAYVRQALRSTLSRDR